MQVTWKQPCKADAKLEIDALGKIRSGCWLTMTSYTLALAMSCCLWSFRNCFLQLIKIFPCVEQWHHADNSYQRTLQNKTEPDCHYDHLDQLGMVETGPGLHCQLQKISRQYAQSGGLLSGPTFCVIRDSEKHKFWVLPDYIPSGSYRPKRDKCEASFLLLLFSAAVTKKGCRTGMWFSHPFSWLLH